MIPTETVGNPDLESEYLAGCILHGNINDPSYLNLRMNLASLKFIDVSQTLIDTLTAIQKMVVTPFGLIERPVVKQYYQGNAKELYKLVVKAEKEVTNLSIAYETAIPEKLDEMYLSMGSQIENTPMTYEDVGQAVGMFQGDNDQMTQMDTTLQDLKRMRGVLQAILRIYQEGNPKVSNKDIPAKLSTEYKIFLQELSQNLDIATDNMLIAMVVSKGLDAIISTIPKDDLDPYLTDVCNNIIAALTDPKDYYNMCQRDAIISPAVGQMFGHCYPEFHSKYADMYMEDYDKLTHQESIDFRMCFGMDADDSELTALCSQYVKLGFVQQ